MEDLARIATRAEDLLRDIGYTFTNGSLFREALTHKSYSNEQPGASVGHNERLEFLGDAVLDMVVSHMIFIAYPDLPEGELTRIRAEVVSEPGLVVVARRLAIGDYLWLGRGETRTGGRKKESLMANALEALLGAIYCDGGLEPVRQVVGRLFTPTIEEAFRHKAGIDYKTRLQELMQARHGLPPAYRLVHTEGPDHHKTYTIEVLHGGRSIGCGSGVTKKAASQQAARQALESLGE